MILKDHENKNDNMYEYSQSWRRRLRLQFLVDIARIELKSGKKFDEFSQKLDKEMQIRWRLVPSTRKQYLNTVRKVISNQFVLIH
ncbi:MAG: hypothetical protein OEQ94_00990 [Nitrosopumilus sp.]|nr:hypothetical protein [Nitrosopumilus sp.]MDH3822485.1 hypothetical protein [Nitrosopumilus sp.]